MPRLRITHAALIALVALSVLIAPIALEERETLWGIDARSGRPSWKRDVTEAHNANRGQLEVEALSGVVYTIVTYGWPEHRVVVTALDPANGAPRWTRTLTGEVLASTSTSTLATASGLLLNTVPVRGPYTNTVVMLDNITGETRWSLRGELKWIQPARGFAESLVLVDRARGVMDITTLDPGTGAVQPASGRPTNGFDRYFFSEEAALALPRSVLYLNGAQVALLDLTTALTRPLPLKATGIAYANDMLIGLNDTGIQAYSPATDAIAWQAPVTDVPTQARLRVNDAAASANGITLLMTAKTADDMPVLLGIDAAGARLWQRNLPIQSWGAPRLLVTRDDIAIVRSHDTIFATRAADGAPVWSGTFESFFSTIVLDTQNSILVARGRTARWRAWLYQLGVWREV